MSKMYHSRKYVKEKWDAVKHDIENVLDIYNENTESDSISEEDINRIKSNVKDKIDAIMKELDI